MIIFLSISVNMCFGCPKEPSHRDGSFEYPQHMFWLRNKNFFFRYVLLSGGLLPMYLGSLYCKQYGPRSDCSLGYKWRSYQNKRSALRAAKQLPGIGPLMWKMHLQVKSKLNGDHEKQCRSRSACFIRSNAYSDSCILLMNIAFPLNKFWIENWLESLLMLLQQASR